MLKPKTFIIMDWVAYWQGQYGCSSPSTKRLHEPADLEILKLRMFLNVLKVQMIGKLLKVRNCIVPTEIFGACNYFHKNFILLTNFMYNCIYKIGYINKWNKNVQFFQRSEKILGIKTMECLEACLSKLHISSGRSKQLPFLNRIDCDMNEVAKSRGDRRVRDGVVRRQVRHNFLGLAPGSNIKQSLEKAKFLM